MEADKRDAPIVWNIKPAMDWLSSRKRCQDGHSVP